MIQCKTNQLKSPKLKQQTVLKLKQIWFNNYKVYQKVSLHVILLVLLLYCIQVELDDKRKPKRTLHIKNILVAISSGYNIIEMADT